MTQRDINWVAIREEYEAGTPLRQLSMKYSVSKTYIIERRNKENWDRPSTEPRPTTTNSRSNTRDVNAAGRVQIALKVLLEEGLTWDEVAARAGYASRGAAHNAVMREFDRCITHDVKELRTRELYMLNRLQARCYKAAIDEGNKDWTWTIDRFVALSKRKSELMGMDTPVDTNLSTSLVVVRGMPVGYLEEPPKPAIEMEAHA
jgi:hypothetical protein